MAVLAHLDRQSNSLFWPMIHSYPKPYTDNIHSQPNGKGAHRMQTGASGALGASAEPTEGVFSK
jgi:hypothetical protein